MLPLESGGCQVERVPQQTGVFWITWAMMSGEYISIFLFTSYFSKCFVFSFFFPSWKKKLFLLYPSVLNSFSPNLLLLIVHLFSPLVLFLLSFFPFVISIFFLYVFSPFSSLLSASPCYSLHCSLVSCLSFVSPPL